MMITITYSPELNIYTASNGRTTKTYTADEIPHMLLKPLFLKAKDAVLTGKAISGIHVEV